MQIFKLDGCAERQLTHVPDIYYCSSKTTIMKVSQVIIIYVAQYEVDISLPQAHPCLILIVLIFTEG